MEDQDDMPEPISSSDIFNESYNITPLHINLTNDDFLILTGSGSSSKSIYSELINIINTI